MHRDVNYFLIKNKWAKTSLTQAALLLMFVSAPSYAKSERIMSVLNYQGVVNGTVEFDKVYCSTYPGAPETLDVSAPDMPVVRDGRFFGPRLSLVAGRKLEFVPDQYHQRPINTFSYDMLVTHPGITWSKGDYDNFVINFTNLKMTSYTEEGDARFIYVTGEIYCNVGAREAVDNFNNTLRK